MSAHFGTLTHTFGSSRIASSAYQKWPTKDSIFYIECVQAHLSSLHILPI